MRSDFWYDSKGCGKIHGCRWDPVGEPQGVVQIIHGIAEYIERYDEFAGFLNGLGYIVVGEDHMGHGGSIQGGSTMGYFHGDWFTAIGDSYQLLKDTRAEYPDLPYVLLGHSMGSFMARTILCNYPDSGIRAAIIVGTGWQPAIPLTGLIKALELTVGRGDRTAQNNMIKKLMFGSYNSRVERPRTEFDWINRDHHAVDAYIADPLCGFSPSVGLALEMLKGIAYIEAPNHLEAMKKELPVLFVAGGDDPVGSYGKGVHQAAAAFRKAGMKDVTEKIYPLCRHEILNEINRAEVYADIEKWLAAKILK